jgi:hypothetical protein
MNRLGAACLSTVIILLTCSCRTEQQSASSSPEPPRITSIRVGTFQCSNEITVRAVRNVFAEVLLKHADVKVVQDGEADVVIEGTVTTSTGSSACGGVGGGQSLILGRAQNAGGDYVSGVTCLALRNGDIFSSASWGQNLGKGEPLLAPETVAREAANRLLSQLFRKGLKEK